MIGIFAPYRRCETTAAALRLADLANKLGQVVRFAASEPVRLGVHPHWDTRVVRPQITGADRSWLKECDHVVWFDPEVFSYHVALKKYPKIRHHLVPSWHRLSTERLVETSVYPNIVCPTSAAIRHWQRQFMTAPQPRNFSYCPWDSGITLVPRTGFVARGQTRLFVWLNGSAIRDFGDGVCTVLARLLEAIPDLYVTVYRERSLSGRLKRRFDALFTAYPQRCVRAPVASAYELPWLLREQDWTWIPATTSDFGADALLAKACGTAVVTWQLPPFDTCTVDNVSGVHVPCRVDHNWFGSPRAIPVGVVVEQTLHRVLVDRDLREKLHLDPSVVALRRQTFETFWARAWSLEIP